MKTKGILFDYNGVIVNDEHLQEAALRDVVKELGVDLAPELYAEKCLGRTDAEAIAELQKDFPTLAAVPLAELVGRKVAQYQRIVRAQSILQPGIKDVIAALAEVYCLAVVTGSLRLEVEPVLQGEGLEKFFEAVITADDITRGKPHPEGYIKGIAALQLPVQQIVVIEDTPTGVTAAKAAGLKCIAVEHTVPKEKLGQADVIFKHAASITPDVITQLLS